MRKAKIDWQMNIYANAVHAFTNPDADRHGIPGIAYNKEADRRSFQAMVDLFNEVFGAKPADHPSGQARRLIATKLICAQRALRHGGHRELEIFSLCPPCLSALCAKRFHSRDPFFKLAPRPRPI